MIGQHMDLALDLSKVKAIYVKDMDLVFEMDNILLTVYNLHTEEEEIQSFTNSPVIYGCKTIDTLHNCYKRWVGMWDEYKTKDSK